MHASKDDRIHFDESGEQGRQIPMNLSKSQYEQLLNLLGTLQVGVDCLGSMVGRSVN